MRPSPSGVLLVTPNPAWLNARVRHRRHSTCPQFGTCYGHLGLGDLRSIVAARGEKVQGARSHESRLRERLPRARMNETPPREWRSQTSAVSTGQRTTGDRDGPGIVLACRRTAACPSV